MILQKRQNKFSVLSVSCFKPKKGKTWSQLGFLKPNFSSFNKRFSLYKASSPHLEGLGSWLGFGILWIFVARTMVRKRDQHHPKPSSPQTPDAYIRHKKKMNMEITPSKATPKKHPWKFRGWNPNWRSDSDSIVLFSFFRAVNFRFLLLIFGGS